jgi:electron transfer flavoprotein alpha subunit
VDILIENGYPNVMRQMYNGKLFSKVSFKKSECYLVTVREGVFPPDMVEGRQGEVMRQGIPADLPGARKQFVE